MRFIPQMQNAKFLNIPVERDIIYSTIHSYKIKYAERKTQDSSESISIFNIKKKNKYVRTCTYNYDKKNTKQTNNKYTLKHKNTHKIYTKNQRKTTTKIPLKYVHVTVLIIIKSVKLYISPLSDTYVQ